LLPPQIFAVTLIEVRPKAKLLSTIIYQKIFTKGQGGKPANLSTKKHKKQSYQPKIQKLSTIIINNYQFYLL